MSMKDNIGLFIGGPLDNQEREVTALDYYYHHDEAKSEIPVSMSSRDIPNKANLKRTTYIRMGLFRYEDDRYRWIYGLPDIQSAELNQWLKDHGMLTEENQSQEVQK